MIAHFFTLFFFLFFAYYIGKFLPFLHKILREWWMCRGIDGPETLPLIGSLHKLPSELSEMDKYHMEEARKVLMKGKNLMKIWYGPILRVYLLDSEAAKIITNSNIETVKGKDYDFLKRWLGNGLLTSYGEKWQRNRKLLTPAFHFQKLDEYNEIIDYHVRTFVQILNSKANGQEIDFIQYAKHVTLDIIMQATMGVCLNLQEDNNHPYVKAVSKFSELVDMRFTNPFYSIDLVWRLSGYEKETQQVLTTLKSLTTQVIDQRMQQQQIESSQSFDQTQKRRPDFLDILLEQTHENRMTVEEMREQIDTFMSAGHDTTSHAISWTIWCLATNVDKQEALYKELTETFGQSDADFCTNKLKDLKYLDAVIKESLRAYPPVPFTGRELQQDVKFGEHCLPKGTTIVIPQLFLHHNEKVFTEHMEFKPERFTDGQEYASNTYIPFSAGPRNCIGMRFAQNEIRIAIAHLIFNFKFWADHKMTDNWTMSEVILRPGLGIPVKLKRRF